ncbi:MAG: hypothetical protein ACREOO_20310 [bacterium]
MLAFKSNKSVVSLAAFTILLSWLGCAIFNEGWAQASSQKWLPDIPKTWDEKALASLELPLVDSSFSPVHISAEYYYGIPVRPVYKNYPVYAPAKEPAGYIAWLRQQKPEIAFEAAKLKTKEDWIKAGALVFDAPIVYGTLFIPVSDHLYLRDSTWYQAVNPPVAKDGTLPFYRYVIREQGKIEVGLISCGMCHTRVMPDGSIIKGGQGNFPFDRALAYDFRTGVQDVKMARAAERVLYAAPWLKPDPYAQIDSRSQEEIAALHEVIPAGIAARHGSSPMAPIKIPDLFDIQDRKYFDATGLMRHRDLGDLMRYAALNQDGDFLARHGNFIPQEAFEPLPQDPAQFQVGRYSDEQLYALALYVYALKPPLNPNKLDSLAAYGQKIFEREGCSGCHTPPLYTNNKLTPAAGFKVPARHYKIYDLKEIYVNTNPDLALKTRRGTGYYKVPSLRHVWARGPLQHSGAVATLEDWLNPDRVEDDYVPTGFHGHGAKYSAVEGHPFGLELSDEDRSALIAFLKTL